MKELLTTYFITAVMFLGLPLVNGYISLCRSPFLNTYAADARGLEAVGNLLLKPTQYLLDGKKAQPTGSAKLPYTLVEEFDYTDCWKAKTIAAVVLLPPSLLYGSLVKGASLLLPEPRSHQQKICQSLESSLVVSNREGYLALGLAVEEAPERLTTAKYERHPGALHHMAEEKAALAAVVEILKKEKIPFWLDCGTCLGAYRYGGIIPWDHDIDIAILQPDSDNVLRALNALDSSRFIVQDWSSRGKEKTQLKVYIKNSAFGGSIALIDIYHYAINTRDRTLDYIFSAEENLFFPPSKKAEERRFTAPVPYEMIFPLKKANFDGIEVYVPNKTKEYLHVRYGPNIEPAKVYDEAAGRYVKVEGHPYWQS